MNPICAKPPALVPVTPAAFTVRVTEPVTSERPVLITSVGDPMTSYLTAPYEAPAKPMSSRQTRPASTGSLLAVKTVIRFLRSNFGQALVILPGIPGQVVSNESQFAM